MQLPIGVVALMLDYAFFTDADIVLQCKIIPLSSIEIAVTTDASANAYTQGMDALMSFHFAIAARAVR